VHTRALLFLLLLLAGIGTELYAQSNQTSPQETTIEIDPKILAEAKKKFIKKLGAQTGQLQAKEIPEGFVFDSGKNKLTLLVLWSKDCKRCIDDIPNLNRYFLDFRGKLNIIAIELSGMSTAQLQQFAKEKKILYTLISGVENKAFTARIMQKFGFEKGLPFQVVLGYTGHNNGIVKGKADDPDEMEKFLIKILEHYELKKKAQTQPTQNGASK